MDKPTIFPNLKVIDLTHGYAGAIATMILADNGAVVTRIDPPAPSGYRGDPSRDAAGQKQWHRHKKRLSADLHDPAQRAHILRLIDEADVLVESFRPGTLDRLMLSYEALASRNPRLIYCSITGFGTKGRYRNVPGYEGIVLALAGRMVDFGRYFGWERPVYTAVPMGSFGASQAAVQGICAALHERRSSGRGQYVETSLLQALTAFDMGGWLAVQLHEKYPNLALGPAPLRKAAAKPSMILQYIPARTADGSWLQFANFAPHLFWLEAEMLGLGHLKNDARFADLPRAATPDARDAFWALVLDRVGKVSASAFMDRILASSQVGADRFCTTQEGMDHPQIRHNGHVVKVTDPKLGETEQVGPLAWFSETPSRIGLAEPDSQVLQPAVQGKPASARGALADVLVIEAAAMYAGPFGPSLVNDLGARVIKIEPLDGDLMRQNGFLGIKAVQGKESIALDLKKSEAQAIVHRLVKRATLFMHNYRPGVPERLGIDYQTLRKHNEHLVYLYAGAYGVDGPYAKLPAYHPIAGAVCGNAVLQAGRSYPPPRDKSLDMATLKEVSLRLITANEGNPDVNSALVVATAMLLGLVAHDMHGIGQEIVTTMLGANAYAMSDDWIRYAGKPERPLVDDDLHGTGPLYRLYETKEGWVFLAVTNDAEWRRLVTVPEFAALRHDTRFGNASARQINAGALAQEIGAIFRRQTAESWESDLLAREIACVRADRMGFSEFMNIDQAVRDNGYIVETQHPVMGRHWRHAPIVHLSRTPATMGAGTVIGQHTQAVLEELGYTTEEIADLERRNIIRCGQVSA